MNDAGSHSEHFEELCALAASGQISESEFVELSDHMQNCVECQSVYGDFIDLVHNKLPLADPELTSSFMLTRPSLKESSYRERFIARARKEGLAVSHEVPGGVPENRNGRSWFLWPNFAQLAPLAMALLVVTAGILGYAWFQSNARYTTLEAKLAEINGQTRSQESPEPGPPQVPTPETRPENRSLPLNTARETAAVSPPNSNAAELAQLRQQYEAALANTKAAEERVLQVSAELQIVKEKSESSGDEVAQLQKRLELAELASAQAIGALQIVGDNLKESNSRIAALSRQIQESTNVKLSTPMQTLHLSNVLFADGRGIGDQLLDLRAADFHDVDSNSKQSKASSRVFYTDGKLRSLLVVASGLSKRPGAKGNVFQVWGGRGMNPASAHSLGIFESDNPETDVWSLAVNDPAKLAGVDTVFVTMEKSESKTPAEKRIMYAYLQQIPVKN